VRYLIDGGVFGRAAFVDSVFLRYRERFGPKRTTGARPMREAEWEGLGDVPGIVKTGWRSVG
jgi:hypothetical protein